MSNFTIEFYEKENGQRPVEEFIRKLSDKMRQKVLSNIVVLSQVGNRLREHYAKKLTDDIFELRTQQGSDITRVLFFFFVDKRIVLTNGFVKKTQRTPRLEIRKAKKYREGYIKRLEAVEDEH